LTRFLHPLLPLYLSTAAVGSKTHRYHLNIMYWNEHTRFEGNRWPAWIAGPPRRSRRLPQMPMPLHLSELPQPLRPIISTEKKGSGMHIPNLKTVSGLSASLHLFDDRPESRQLPQPPMPLHLFELLKSLGHIISEKQGSGMRVPNPKAINSLCETLDLFDDRGGSHNLPCCRTSLSCCGL